MYKLLPFLVGLEALDWKGKRGRGSESDLEDEDAPVDAEALEWLDVDGAALEAPVDGDRSGAVLRVCEGRRSSGMKPPLEWLEGARGEAGRRGRRVAGRRRGSVGR